MKKQYLDLIERSQLLLANHHNMDGQSITQEHQLLKGLADLAEEELIEREDECDADSKDLSEGIALVGKVGDVREMHTGGSTTQF